MKRYSVTVNGVVYDVAVEEIDGAAAPVAAAPVAAAPAPKAAPAAPKAAPKAAPVAGGKPVNAPMPGNILAVNVKVGDKVEKGAVLCVLEAMKMENEIVAPIDGVIATVEASQGAAVEEGSVLFTMN